MDIREKHFKAAPSFILNSKQKLHRNMHLLQYFQIQIFYNYMIEIMYNKNTNVEKGKKNTEIFRNSKENGINIGLHANHSFELE